MSRPKTNIDAITGFILKLSLLILQFSGVIGKPQFPCLFIFGDSLVDNGNNNLRNTSAKVDFSPYGIDFPAGPTGRFSNGKNMADVIAQMLGFEKFIPPFANASDADILGGVNYASGGSGILEESGFVNGDVISFNKQLSNHEAAILKMVANLGSQAAAETHLKSCLYYVGIGSNDYLGNYFPKFYSATATFTPEQYAVVLVKQYSQQLRRLYDNGARRIAVVALGEIGCIPQQLYMYGANLTACVEASNHIVRLFNEKVQFLVNGLNNRFPDAKFIYSTPVADEALLGNLKVLNEPCCEVTGERLGRCVEGGKVCSNRDEYYFMDWYHPTEAGVLVTAKSLYQSMSPLFPNSVEVS